MRFVSLRYEYSRLPAISDVERHHGEFLYSLPVVMTCALVASRLVSMTFIPFLAYYLLRPSKKEESTMEERETRGFTGFYYRVGKFAIDHRCLFLEHRCSSWLSVDFSGID